MRTAVFFVALVAALASGLRAQDVLVPRGATWRFLDDGSNQGARWILPGFDDSGWSTGDAEFGFGDGDEVTLIDAGPQPLDKHITTYFRTTFDVPDPALFAALEVRLKRDDGAACYLNGVEIVRSNLSEGPLVFNTHAIRPVESGSEEAFLPYYERPLALVAGRNTLAVELHLSNPQTHDSSFDLELIGHKGPSITRGPYVQMVSDSAATLRFRTIVPAPGRVRVGEAPDQFQQEVVGTGPVTEHELRVEGLEPETRYYYTVGTLTGATDVGGSEYWFETAPAPGSRTPFRVWAVGDAGTYNADQRRVRDAFEAVAGSRHTDLMLLLGDNAYRAGDDQAYQLAVFEMYHDTIRNTPSWSTRGNHELFAESYFGAFTLPDQAQAGGLPSGVEDYYSFDWGNVHFVCLDSWASDKAVTGPMYRWCEADLQSTTQDWIVAFFHHPPYSDGSHDSDSEQELIDMREIFVPLLEDHGVALVLCGHSHAYERSYLMDRHYGGSASFDPAVHALDAGLGREANGAGAYSRAPGPHGGAVYAVAGSSGRVSSGGMLAHPAMVVSRRQLGSVVLDVIGGRMDVTFLDDTGARADWFTLVDSTWDGGYCVGSVNGEGCVATLSTVGAPSLTSGAPFIVRADQMRTGATSMLLYGLEPASLPLAGGRLCIGSPIYRTPHGNSAGTAPCTGSHQLDFATLWSTPQHGAFQPGDRVHCQVWYRDTTPAGSSLSEGLVFVLEP